MILLVKQNLFSVYNRVGSSIFRSRNFTKCPASRGVVLKKENMSNNNS